MFKQLYFIGLLVFTSKVVATEKTNVKQLVEHAIDQLEQTSRQHWAYQIDRYENEEGDITSSIERFHPGNSQATKWTLLQLNGKTPTEKQQAKFRKEKAERKKDREKKNSYTIALRELINIDSIKHISIDETYHYLAFDVTLSQLSDKANKELAGKLYYNREGAFIERIEISNNDSFSPIFGAKITDLNLNIYFIKRADDILPRQQDMTMKGTFAFFTEIDEVSKDIYSNYKRNEFD